MPIARAAAEGSPVAATSTGRPAFSSTSNVSDEYAMARRPRPPCDAMKMRSQPASRAAPTIACAGLSLTVCIDAHGTPNARAAASALASSSRGRPLNA
jgi:hypothetical protein